MYLVRHPGFSSNVPITDTINPNVFIFDIDNLPAGEEGYHLISGFSPESLEDYLVQYPNAYLSVNSQQGNLSDIISIFTPDSRGSLLDFLEEYDYHLGFFSVDEPSAEMPLGKFHLSDFQTSSLASKLSMVQFYDGILFFVDLKSSIGKIGGYDQRYARDPVKLTDRIIRYLTMERDDHPFLIYLNYFSLPLRKSAESSIPETGFKNLFNYLEKSGILDNSIMIFTSLSTDKIHIPLYISYGNSVSDPDQSPAACSLRDIAITIVSVITEKEHQGRHCRSLVSYGEETARDADPVIIFREGNHPDRVVEYVIDFPYALHRTEDGEEKLLDISDNDDYLDISAENPELLEQMSAFIKM